MLSVRELIQMLLLNCDLDDTVEVEIRSRPLDAPYARFDTYFPKRVTHIAADPSDPKNNYKSAVIECHDD